MSLEQDESPWNTEEGYKYITQVKQRSYIYMWEVNLSEFIAL